VALHQAGDLERAADGYRRALRADPRYALAYNNLGVSLAERHDWPSAREAFLRACTLDASAGVARRNLALTHVRANEPLAALAVLRELVAFHADDASAWMLLSDVYRRLHRVAESQDAELQALATPPHPLARGYDRLAVGIELQRECPVSVGPVDLLRFARQGPSGERPDASATTAPSDPPREQTIGEARSLVLLGRAAEALPLVRELAREAPDHPELLVLFAAGIIDERGFAGTQAAQLALSRLHNLAVESAGLLHFAGDVAMRTSNEQLALGFYRRALAMDPTRPTPRVAVARVLRRRGDLLAAQLELVAALAKAPYWSDAVTELARLHLAQGQPAAARLALVAYLQQAPADLSALALLVESLVAEDRLMDARVALDRLLPQDPANPAGVWFDGVLLAAQSRERDAAARWARLAVDPDGEPWSRLAREALTKTMIDAGLASPRRRRPAIVRSEAVA
jgi:predicted Zn-dependent protease